MLSIRDPIHGFIQTDELETALLKSRPLQRLRYVHQLGVTYLVYPGAEHSRFNHTMGVMHLAGRIYDALAARSGGLLPEGNCRERRLVRVAALVHDIGHAPFSHSAEDLFEGGIDHEDMTQRLLETPELRELFRRHGDGIDTEQVMRVLRKDGSEMEFLLSEIVTSELDVDKMDYLRRDSLYCGVQYGSYDLEQLIQTVIPIQDPHDGVWRIGVDHTGVHALEGLVMARYYMFTQVYFNVTSKVMELHFNQWLRSQGREWASDPERFLREDDITVLQEMRTSDHPHARAIIHRERFSLAYETSEHLSREERDSFQAILPGLRQRFGDQNLLVDNSNKDPHRLAKNRVWVRRRDGDLAPMSQASDFIAKLSRIDAFRVYAPKALRRDVNDAVQKLWGSE
ncbi:MAG: HD domain-containing protein [Thermoanaerobaculia bacterium]|nr:HD domain-containing protein [Thermoanaerobaculia bacterium]